MSRFAWEVTLQWAGVGFYILSFVAFAICVLFGKAKWAPWGKAFAIMGLVPHGVALGVRWVASGHGPYMLKYEVFSSNAWVAVALLVAFLHWRPTWGAVSLVVMPAALTMVALGLFSNPEIRDLPPTLRSMWLVYHVLFAKLAAAAFLLSVATSIFVLLKGRRDVRPWLERLPSVEALDAFTVRFVGFGFIFWTVTLIAGAIWANQSWGSYWSWEAVQTWSLVTWILYGLFLHVRLFFKLKVVATAWWTLACFALFILTLLILPFILPSLHSAYFQ